MPAARIMTFGYDSSLAFSKSRAGIESFARDLLNRLRLLRTDYEVCSPCSAELRNQSLLIPTKCQDRPLVFITHSLGGIVAKQVAIAY